MALSIAGNFGRERRALECSAQAFVRQWLHGFHALPTHLIPDDSFSNLCCITAVISGPDLLLVSEVESSHSPAGDTGAVHERLSRDTWIPELMPMPELAIEPTTPREVIASVVMQYLSEARSEPLEDLDFSTPFMDAGLDSLDMLKVRHVQHFQQDGLALADLIWPDPLP